MRKRIAILVMMVLLAALVTSCKDAIEVDELVYVASIGIDKGVSDYWRLSVKYPVTQKSGGQSSGQGQDQGGGSSSKGQGEPYDVLTMDTPSFFTGADMIDSNITRHMNFQHLKFIVISEEIAREGSLEKYLAPIMRFREIRRTSHVLICKGSAQEFLQKNNPTVGSSLTKNLEDWILQMEHTGFYPSTTLKDFYNNMKSTYQQPTALLAAVNTGQNFKQDGPKAEKSININAEYTAGELPVKGGNNVEIFGCALFDGDKMTETLDGYETRLMLMVAGDFIEGNFTVQDPLMEDLLIAIKLELRKHPDIKIDLKGGNPKISIQLHLKGEILGIQGTLNYEGQDLKPVLEQSIAAQLDQDFDALFQKCKPLGEDVFGFGGIAARQFYTVQDWEQYRWFQRFKTAETNLQVDLTIERSGTNMKTYPIVSTESEQQ
jgi:Ger(x)C family germination protein